jgi:hypothetical protein
MDASDFSVYVLEPALNLIGLYSLSAHCLMLGTALQESNLDFLVQKGCKEAKGVYQMELATYSDIGRYLNKPANSKLKQRCLSACFYDCTPSPDALIHNLRWSTIMARIKYEMIPWPIPNEEDAPALAQYYKRYYNTAGGKAEVDKVIPVFQHALRIIKS